MVSKRNECEVLVGICEGKRPFSIEYIVIDGGMIVKRVISKQDGCVLYYCGGLMRTQSQSLGFIKCWSFIDWGNNYSLLQRYPSV